MKAKINKALDLNGLFNQQAQGKLLKKHIKFPLLAQCKYDGNYTITEVKNGHVTHITSGSLNYTSTDDASDIFRCAVDGYYIAERIGGEGKLGDRVKCNLRGPKTNQTSTGHSYKVFDYLTIDEYITGASSSTYTDRNIALHNSGIPEECIVSNTIIHDQEDLDAHLQDTVNAGYEGLMLYQPDFMWRDTKSRTVNLAKYKGRRTADLECIDITEGIGKYTGMIGSLVLRDSKGRIVSVGSGLNDDQREYGEFIGKVIEIKFEQIIDTYIQPTFVQVRGDKTIEEID